jgi:cytoskeletal protein CcmA (bactofilin family)
MYPRYESGCVAGIGTASEIKLGESSSVNSNIGSKALVFALFVVK